MRTNTNETERRLNLPIQAEENCIKRKGHLASVSSAVSNGVLLQIGGLISSNEFWLGASWDTQLPGQWAWTDGRRFSYHNWAVGQFVFYGNSCGRFAARNTFTKDLKHCQS